MGVRDWFRSLGSSWPTEAASAPLVGPIGDPVAPMAWFSPNVTYIGGAGMDDVARAYGLDVSKLSVGQLWASQPHLRTVVSFLARNTAQLGLHVFERLDETDRKRDRESPLAQLLSRPNGYMTTYELVFALAGDLALHDVAYWYVQPNSSRSSGWELHRLPPSWVTPKDETAFEVRSYRVSANGRETVIPASDVLTFAGYSPRNPRRGSPTLDALRHVLQEQVESNRYREQVWRRGGRASAVLTRPANAPEWSDAARQQFREDWYAQYTGDGPRAGGTPILADGMKLERVDYSATDQQWVEGARLALEQVAAAFHVQPAMVGQTAGISYASVREFRKMLYGETLGPTLRQIEDRLNTFLADMIGAGPGVYVEFNVESKLRGSFEEQAAVLQASVGAPYMTRNEARARMNLPSAEGGDELVTPLNVLIGGQASPQDSAPPDADGVSL